MRHPLAATLLIPCLLAACQSAPPQRAPLAITAAQYDAAMDAAASALREHGFRVERFDPRMGVVAAIPEGIPSSAEWWKGNAPNAGEWEAEANLQDLRHRARITLTQAGDAYALAAEVTVERLDVPTQRVTASVASPTNNLSEVPSHWRQRGVKDNEWQKIGRDRALEAKLMDDVEKRLQ